MAVGSLSLGRGGPFLFFDGDQRKGSETVDTIGALWGRGGRNDSSKEKKGITHSDQIKRGALGIKRETKGSGRETGSKTEVSNPRLSLLRGGTTEGVQASPSEFGQRSVPSKQGRQPRGKSGKTGKRDYHGRKRVV